MEEKIKLVTDNDRIVLKQKSTTVILRVINVILTILWVPFFFVYAMFSMAGPAAASSIPNFLQYMFLFSIIIAICCWISSIRYRKVDKQLTALILHFIPIVYYLICYVIALAYI